MLRLYNKSRPGLRLAKRMLVSLPVTVSVIVGCRLLGVPWALAEAVGPMMGLLASFCLTGLGLLAANPVAPYDRHGRLREHD